MWDRDQMRSQMRTMILNPTEQQVFNRTLDQYLQRGVTDAGAAVGLPALTLKTSVPLEVDVYEYLLTSDILRVQEVWWNDKPLDFADISAWRRDRIDWRAAESGVPREVAVDGRELFLYPPPDSTALATDPNLTLRVQLVGHLITENGVPGFDDALVLLAVRMAAYEFMAVNNVDGRYDRSLKTFPVLIQSGSTQAQQRYAQMLAESNPGMSAWSGRTGPAR